MIIRFSRSGGKRGAFSVNRSWNVKVNHMEGISNLFLFILQYGRCFKPLYSKCFKIKHMVIVFK